jgi:hypothetical protein
VFYLCIGIGESNEFRCEELSKELLDCLHIFLGELSDSRDGRLICDLEEFLMDAHGSALRKIGELAFNELLHIDVSVKVSALRERSGDERAACVDCLEHSSKVDSSGDLFDENRGQSLGSEFLVDA